MNHFLQVSTFFEAWPIVINIKSGLIENVSILLCFPNYTDLLILIDKSYWWYEIWKGHIYVRFKLDLDTLIKWDSSFDWKGDLLSFPQVPSFECAFFEHTQTHQLLHPLRKVRCLRQWQDKPQTSQRHHFVMK